MLIDNLENSKIYEKRGTIILIKIVQIQILAYTADFHFLNAITPTMFQTTMFLQSSNLNCNVARPHSELATKADNFIFSVKN